MNVLGWKKTKETNKTSGRTVTRIHREMMNIVKKRKENEHIYDRKKKNCVQQQINQNEGREIDKKKRRKSDRRALIHR